MWPGNRLNTGTCPCCKVCKNCPGFQKVLDRPNSGFILYRHITHVEDINKKTGVIEATTETIDDVFIIENTQGAALEKIDFTPEIDQKQISCPRCVKILERAQNLFKNQEIGNSNVIGVCEHCRQKSQRERSCLKCDEIVEKFQLSKSEEKQTHAQRVKTWLSKIQQLIKLAVDDGKSNKTGSPLRRGHSDIDISKIFRKIPKTDHEPEIEDLFLQNIRGLQSVIKGPGSERSYFPGAIKEVVFYEPDETKPIYATPQDEEDFQPLFHSQSNATLTGDELEKDFIRKYGKSYKVKRSFEDPTGRIRYVDEKYNDFIPFTGVSYDDEDYVSAPKKQYDVHGRKKENLLDSDLYQGGKDHENEYIPGFDTRQGGVKRMKSITESDSHHEGGRRKEPVVEYDWRPEGVRRKEIDKESDSHYEGGRRKEQVSTDSKHYASDIKKDYILSDSESRREIRKRKEQGPAASKYREDDKNTDFIPTPKTRHEEEKKKPSLRRDDETPDETKKRVNQDTKKEDFITVIGKRFEEEIEAKGLTLAPKKSHEPKKRKDLLTTASETRLKQDTISTEKDQKIGKKDKTGTKIIFESPSRIKKYHSEESLIAGISKMKDEMQGRKTFDLYFPEKPEARKKKLKVESATAVSSAELIKDTIDKMKTKSEKEKRKREEADKIKAEREKKLEEEKLEEERLYAEKLASKLARDKEREQEKHREKGLESRKDDMSNKDQDTSHKDVLSKKDQEASKKDQDAIKRDKDVSKKDQEVSKKKGDAEMVKEKTAKDKSSQEKVIKDKPVQEKVTKEKPVQEQVTKDKPVQEQITKDKPVQEKVPKDKTLQENMKKEADKKGKEGEVDISAMKNKSKDEDQFKAAKIKTKEDKSSEEKPKDKGKGKDANIVEKKDIQEKEMRPKDDKDAKSKEGTANKRDPEAEKLLNQLEQDKKDREKLQQELRQQKEEEKRLKSAAEQKAKETGNQLAKKEKETQPSKKQVPAAEEKPKEPVKPPKKEKEIELPKKLFPTKKVSRAKILDLIVPSKRPKERKRISDVSPLQIKSHGRHRSARNRDCDICNDSDLELDLQSLLRQKQEALEKKGAVKEAVIGKTIYKYKTQLPQPKIKEEIKPALFQKQFEMFGQEVDYSQLSPARTPDVKAKQKPVDPDYGKGVVRYALSDRTFIEKGWTMLPTEKVVRKMNVYRMRPAHPEFDWFEHNKMKGMLEYDSGEKLAEFDDNGRGRWYYRNGKLALDYYDAEELNAQQRFVIYSSGEPDERGRTHPRTVLATFDYLGNGCVFDHAGKIRLKYNQTEGVVLDRTLGPVSHWKWHTLNDPPVLQQVMIDTQMAHKDPQILKLGSPAENKPRPDDEEMLAIEFDNFIKEKSAKLSQSFKPFQIKMKALKINEYFSLRVLDQATVYLLYRDGTTNIKLNIGMILDHKEIVDTDTAEVGEVSNNVERLPARTDSLAELQRNVANAQRIERSRSERERRLRRPEPCASADRLTAAASRPLKPPLRTVESRSTVGGTKLYCKCRKPTACNVYYDTSLI